MTTLHLIGIQGKAHSGKDTIGDYIKKNYNGIGYAYADPVKEVAKKLFMFDNEQLYGSQKEVIDERWNISPRQALQVIGTNLMQFAIYGFLPNMINKVPVRDFWIHHFKLWYDDFILKPENKDKIIVVTDVRFMNEFNIIRELNGLLIKIVRPELDTTTIMYDHPSETSLDNIEPDITIINDDTKDTLYGKVDNILQQYNNQCE